jgi:penicillin-binding protein 1C
MSDRPRRRVFSLLAAGLLIAAAALALATRLAMRDLPDDLRSVSGDVVKSQILARDGTALSVTRENAWNTTDTVPLTAIPLLLQTAVIVAEDQHFYTHHGVDWTARGAALWLDLRARAPLRGASTITEQVVHMLHPRPRTLWSRWVAGFEAARLEARIPKPQILEFYLNQVPYAERRRGVAEAARHYFDRGLDTLSPGEQLALAVLIRSPGGMDLRHDAPRARRALEQLADRLQRRGDLTAAERLQVHNLPWVLGDAADALDAGDFVAHVLAMAAGAPQLPAQIRTTLDPRVQRAAQSLLDEALAGLARRHVQDGGLIVIDHERNEVLGWVVAHGRRPAREGPAIAGYDTVLAPRQPGSTLKPLLYAMALERGWTAATLIDDSELAEALAGGQHTFHNYSHRHYGPVRLRDALANSLNIPAVKTLQFVGGDAFLQRLHTIGVTSLTQHPEFYGDGLALGNGEVSLYEMAQAYTVLARGGRYRPLTLRLDDGADTASPSARARRDVGVVPPAIATLIGNILADPEARRLEFGRGLQFPVETAIKTGTSTDYRDAWAIAFDYRHTVAVWMGNLDGSAMDGVTGAVGPAMVLRSLFSELNRDRDTRPLALSRDLLSVTICRRNGRSADGSCDSLNEWFVPGTQPASATGGDIGDIAAAPRYRLLQPTAGLQVAHDPRIPDEFQALPMEVAGVPGLARVDWYIDGVLAARTTAPRYPWPLQAGTHSVRARLWIRRGDGRAADSGDDDGAASAQFTDDIRFHVH